ncbi:hypothetical protein ACJX0J_023951 [Zea mays]
MKILLEYFFKTIFFKISLIVANQENANMFSLESGTLEHQITQSGKDIIYLEMTAKLTSSLTSTHDNSLYILLGKQAPEDTLCLLPYHGHENPHPYCIAYKKDKKHNVGPDTVFDLIIAQTVLTLSTELYMFLCNFQALTGHVIVKSMIKNKKCL